ncbi:MAG TPA: hypothetical protein VF657_06930 [Actinoplanes sp.]
MSVETQTVVYRQSSVLGSDGLALETAGLHPCFFTGFLTAARVVAVG